MIERLLEVMEPKLPEVRRRAWMEARTASPRDPHEKDLQDRGDPLMHREWGAIGHMDSSLRKHGWKVQSVSEERLGWRACIENIDTEQRSLCVSASPSLAVQEAIIRALGGT